MKSITMIPPMSRSRSWRTTSSAASRLFFVIVSSSRARLAAADERPGVDVDHRQRLGVVEDQVAAAGQVDPPGERRVDHLLDPERLEQRLVLLPQLDPVDHVRRGALEERHQPVVLLGVIDDRSLERQEKRSRTTRSGSSASW